LDQGRVPSEYLAFIDYYLADPGVWWTTVLRHTQGTDPTMAFGALLVAMGIRTDVMYRGPNRLVSRFPLQTNRWLAKEVLRLYQTGQEQGRRTVELVPQELERLQAL